MNKITTALAGLALAAGAGVTPALAQGNLFSPPGTFSFSMPTTTTFSASGNNDSFNPTNSAITQIVGFTLTGTEVGMSNTYVLNSLVITVVGSATPTFTYNPMGNPLDFAFNNVAGTPIAIASLGADNTGTTFNLVSGMIAPPAVPEASTTASFGLLLALGGLAIAAKRKKAASSL